MGKYRYTIETLESIVKASLTWAQVCRELGIPPATGSQTHLKARAVKEGLDFSHFIGQASNKGKVFGAKHPIEDYLNNERTISSDSLKKRLFKDGLLVKKCYRCGITEWLNEEAVLELDHKDSNHFNNNLDNLQILCPNCHAAKTVKFRRDRSNKKMIEDQRALAKLQGKKFLRKKGQIRKRKFDPSKEELEKLVWDMPTTRVAVFYGVSDKAIDRRCKLLEISKPGLGYWQKLSANTPKAERTGLNPVQ